MVVRPVAHYHMPAKKELANAFHNGTPPKCAKGVANSENQPLFLGNTSTFFTFYHLHRYSISVFLCVFLNTLNHTFTSTHIKMEEAI